MVSLKLPSLSPRILLVLGLFIAAAVISFDAFGDRNLNWSEDSHYGMIAQSILHTGDWIHLRRFNASNFTDHPPLSFWLGAVGMKVFGQNVFGLRLPFMCLAWLSCWLVFAMGSDLESTEAGFFAMLGLLLTRYMPQVSRHITTEIPLMFFATLAAWSYARACTGKSVYLWITGLSVGLSLLTKGAGGALVPFFCLLAFVMSRNKKEMLTGHLVGAVFLSMSLPLCWLYFHEAQGLDGLIHGASRYFGFAVSTFDASGRPGDSGSRLVFLRKLVEKLWLLAPFAVVGIYQCFKDWQQTRQEKYILIFTWVLTFIGVYTLSQWRRGFYLIPMYPAVALFFGLGVVRILPLRIRALAFYASLVFAVGGICFPLLFSHQDPRSLKALLMAGQEIPQARKIVASVMRQDPESAKLIGYGLGTQKKFEFIFSFRDSFDIHICESLRELEGHVSQEKMAVFYFTQEAFWALPVELRKRLSVVHQFQEKIIAVNQFDIKPTLS